MKLGARLALRLLALLALTFVSPTPSADASPADLEFHECAFAAGLGNGECQHFLRNPAGPTDDPCWCDKCRNGGAGQRHDGKTIPPGWNPTLFETGGMDAYLKRHSVAWGITCSECMKSDKPWPDGGPGNIGTVPAKDFAGRPAKATVMNRLEVEKHLFKKPDDVVLAYDRHFYFVTDVSGLKLHTSTGGERAISKHEWIHLMIERAEFARREWVRNLGEPIVLRGQQPRPIAVYIPEHNRDFQRVGAEYFKNAGSNGLRGQIAELCEKMCLTGITFSREENGGDHRMVAVLRHHVSHALLSIWGSLEVRPKSLPIWMDEGLAHWLTKSIEQYRNDVDYCVGEGGGGPSSGSGPTWSGKDWDKDVVKFAQTGRFGPIEDLLGKTVVNELTEEDQKRAWSYFDVCLAEWRTPFVNMLVALRKEKNVREAFMENLGCTPEAFDERWRDRILGRTKSINSVVAPAGAGGGAGGPEAGDGPGAKDRKSIVEEKDPKKLAYKIRQLGEIVDKKTIPIIVDVVAQNLDLPRETALVTLLAVKEPACREALWTYGLSHSDGIVRAYVARVCGRLNITASLPKLEAQLEDKNWYARAEAAVACGMMKYAKAIPALRKMVDSDPSDKARVGAMDALAMFKEDAESAIPLVAKLLDSAQWQLRIVAAQTLGEFGSMEGVEPLIARYEKEGGGRIADEIYEALKKLSRDDLGRKAPNWRKWWEVEKSNSPNGLPKRPEESAPKKGPDPNDPHATHDAAAAPYFGVEIYSNRVAFVCDTSESMQELFTPDPSAAKSLSREYVGNNKLDICKEEIAQTLAKLDPRAHFNIICFGTQIRPFKQNPVPASPGNIDAAKGFLQSLTPAGETNYYDALKAALDIGAEPDATPGFRATPDTITFLTDGEPTKGDILDADVILEWYTGLNRYARVKTHTITFGLVGVDQTLLRGMAERNGGKFTLVPEKKNPAK